MRDYGYVCKECSVAGTVMTPGALSDHKSKHRGHDYEYWNVASRERRMRLFIQAASTDATAWESSCSRDCPDCDSFVTATGDRQAIKCSSCDWSKSV